MQRTDIRPLIEAAILAPSSHNTQPWIFRLGNTIELLADRTRALPVNDPFDRELTISCGAALMNLRVAAASRGLIADVDTQPLGEKPDLLARIQLREGAADEQLKRLHVALDKRHTTREPFQRKPVSGALIRDLIAAVAAEGARLQVVDGELRKRVASLIAEGDRLQFGNSSWRRELASWMHPRRKGDGLAAPAALVPLSRLVVRHFDLGSRVGDSDEALALRAPLLAVLTTTGDEAEDWLEAGQALERALLTGALQEVQAGYLNQPCQVEQLRSRLAELTGSFPQIVLRLGVPKSAPKRSPRRPVQAVLLNDERVDG